ncbi:putative protein LONGIFOLIA 1/2 [Rosa chinensis]|uniref:Uncharacterized protein n=1 Tax=Rosa chinensis TaxID=74649 RepID=A0A2P6QJD7_ROSCH|nr:protein LONGIFOLIA 2 isoform X3 [Rosa chinensis]PRQ34288.1 putative protein LONGIFOLIA 1/2 [Rosa chinensis]
MAAKLLHSLADDNPDLQKQIGCMNGIFQIFDRHQVLTGRRISHHKRLPPGNSHYSNGGLERESNNPYHRQAVTVWDATAADPKLLVFLKSYMNFLHIESG